MYVYAFPLRTHLAPIHEPECVVVRGFSPELLCSLGTCVYIYIHTNISMHVYTYREREREKYRDMYIYI